MPRLPRAALLLLGRPVGAIVRFLCFTGSVWYTPMEVAGMAAGSAGLVEAVSMAVPCSWHLLCAGVLAGSDRTLLPAARLLLASSVDIPCTETQGQEHSILRP